MPDYRSMFDREYIGAWDLPPGRDAVVVIRDVKGAELTAQGGRKAKKPASGSFTEVSGRAGSVARNEPSWRTALQPFSICPPATYRLPITKSAPCDLMA